MRILAVRTTPERRTRRSIAKVEKRRECEKVSVWREGFLENCGNWKVKVQKLPGS